MKNLPGIVPVAFISDHVLCKISTQIHVKFKRDPYNLLENLSIKFLHVRHVRESYIRGLLGTTEGLSATTRDYLELTWITKRLLHITEGLPATTADYLGLTGITKR